jgi:hypothetical protein
MTKDGVVRPVRGDERERKKRCIAVVEQTVQQRLKVRQWQKTALVGRLTLKRR